MKQFYMMQFYKIKSSIFIFLLLAWFLDSKLMAQPRLIGLTPQGGNVFGTIYSANLNGANAQVEYSFEGNAGAFPYYTKLCAANNGKLYGTTSQGGRFNQGVLYALDSATHQYQKIIDFDGSNLGASPRGSLILAKNGKLYGMCTQGGINNNGTIFEFNPNNDALVKLFDFNGTNSGKFPYSSLVEVGNGDFYGLCYQGGLYNEGVLFEYKLSLDSLVKHVDFDGNVKGRNPFGSLCYASNGLLYGMTYQGGANNFGTFFSFQPGANAFTVRFDFNGSVLGSNPYGTPVEHSNKHLYALTYLGGSSNFGTLIEYNPIADTCIKRHDFTSGQDGRNPQGNLSLLNGLLYGLTPFGGTSNAGIIFTYNTSSNTYTKQIDLPGGKNGFNAYGTLVYNGVNFYGCTYQGGNVSAGTIFKYSPSNNSFTKLIDFNAAKNGSSPFAGIIKASNGRYYGVTVDGGETHDGVLFEFIPESNTFIKKAEFVANVTGKNPYGSLCDAGNGNLYGMCYQGGSGGYGTVYRYDIKKDTLILVNSLDDYTTGRNPYGALTLAPNGYLYGLTAFGGNNDFGVIIKCDPQTNTLTPEFELIDTSGALAFGGLSVYNNTTLYGLAYQGGANDLGVIFKYHLSSRQYTVVHTFDGFNTGSYPQGKLLFNPYDSAFYGTTTKGGSNFSGVLFSYHPNSNTFTKLKDLGNSYGTNSSGNLSLLSNGNIVGTSRNGGTSGKGVLFIYQNSSDSLYTNTAFNDQIGNSPFAELIEYCKPSRADIKVQSCYSYQSPSGKYLWKTSGMFKDTIIASTGCDSILTIELRILDSSVAYVSKETCDSLIAPDGSVLKQSGKYRITITNTAGCDSVIYLTFTRLNNSYDTSVSSCHQYVGPDGNTINNSGRYIYHFVNSRGCDSTYTLDFKVLRSVVDTTIRACRLFVAADNKVYRKSGQYSAILNNYLGCDSIINYQLTIDTLNTSVIANDEVLTAQSVTGTFRWLQCVDYAAIANATNKVFTAAKNGLYAVEVSDNNCKDTSECIQVSNLSSNRINLQQIAVYPNPNNGQFNIAMNNCLDSATYSIYDVNGRLIQEGIFNCSGINSVQLDVSPGVYYLKVIVSRTTYNFQLSKY